MTRARIRVNFFPPKMNCDHNDGLAFIGLSLSNKLLNTPHLLLQIFGWTSRNLGRFDILLGDYLNRHNYQIFDGMLPSAAEERAIGEGKRVRKELSQLISSAGPFGIVNIIPAATLADRNDFSSRLARFKSAHAIRGEVHALIADGTDAFLARKLPSKRHDQTTIDHCAAYQMEELVMFEMLAEEQHNTFVYPGAQLPIMKAIVSGAMNDLSKTLHKLTLVELRIFEDLAQ